MSAAEAASDGGSDGAMPAAESAQLLLPRLERLVALRSLHVEHLNDEGRRLIQRAIFSTYVDCRELGLADDARALISERS